MSQDRNSVAATPVAATPVAAAPAVADPGDGTRLASDRQPQFPAAALAKTADLAVGSSPLSRSDPHGRRSCHACRIQAPRCRTSPDKIPSRQQNTPDNSLIPNQPQDPIHTRDLGGLEGRSKPQPTLARKRDEASARGSSGAATDSGGKQSKSVFSARKTVIYHVAQTVRRTNNPSPPAILNRSSAEPIWVR